jgi:hypothetical protein
LQKRICEKDLRKGFAKRICEKGIGQKGFLQKFFRLSDTKLFRKAFSGALH